MSLGFICVCVTADQGRETNGKAFCELFLLLFLPAAQRASQSTSACPAHHFLTQATPPQGTKSKGNRGDWRADSCVSITMEIQSGNGEESATTVSATPVSICQSPPGWQVERSDIDPAHRQDPQAEKRIERFHVPLASLKRMFEKPAEATTVSTATAHGFSLNSLFMNNILSHLCDSQAFTVSLRNLKRRWAMQLSLRARTRSRMREVCSSLQM